MSVTDPVERVRALLPDPVDELQVAALLESQGVTDAVALDDHGAADVFELAEQVYARLAAEPTAEPEPEPPPERPRAWLDAGHGPLYLMPTTAYPAVFAVLGDAEALRALLFGTSTGWVWGAVTSWVAHRLAGAGAAARALVVLGGLGTAAAALGAVLLALLTGGGPGTVLFVAVLAAFQAAAGALLLHRAEGRLLLAALPAGVAGLVHLGSGYADALVVPVLLAGAATAVLALHGAWRTCRAAGPVGPGRVPPLGVLARGALPGAAHAAAGAALLLHTDARHVLGPLDLAIAVAPLALGMGVVEWRANRLFDRAGRLLRTTGRPERFRAAVWRLLLREYATCLLALGSVALVLMLVLRWSGALTAPGALLVDGHVVLGGAYFLGFVLVRTGGAALAPLLTSGVLLIDVAVVAVVGDAVPDVDVPVFLACGALLSLLLLAALHRSVGQVRHYR
ncbi:hypothetical protein [Saccharothrix syringae]|uniref:Uncharacterized protein n=1 Tax=Saccharothrix syringae TaxID=103733 RepID=A0A5Q0H1U3_SACSY|nr:hypothetical protein [Saccharothrix syringae]QFZ20226.1 hypothetical protein EKG83_24940 [Saccharothrix syringae]